MRINEYNNVKDMDYDTYVTYLQNKYGKATVNYFTPSFNKNAKISRSKEGLFCHHVREDECIMLCEKSYAQAQPFEYQKPDNLVYCNYLEHVLLHILIAEKTGYNGLGIGGVINFLSPELNDLYSGWIPSQAWRQTCFNIISNDKDVYFELLKRFDQSKLVIPVLRGLIDDSLCKSAGARFGVWSDNANAQIYKEIKALGKH